MGENLNETVCSAIADELTLGGTLRSWLVNRNPREAPALLVLAETAELPTWSFFVLSLPASASPFS